jgi:hypothetical protein
MSNVSRLRISYRPGLGVTAPRQLPEFGVPAVPCGARQSRPYREPAPGASRQLPCQLLARQRTIVELEGQVERLLDELPRARMQHSEAEARLVELRRELASLDGS